MIMISFTIYKINISHKNFYAKKWSNKYLFNYENKVFLKNLIVVRKYIN